MIRELNGGHPRTTAIASYSLLDFGMDCSVLRCLRDCAVLLPEDTGDQNEDRDFGFRRYPPSYNNYGNDKDARELGAGEDVTSDSKRQAPGTTYSSSRALSPGNQVCDSTFRDGSALTTYLLLGVAQFQSWWRLLSGFLV